ncbi:MAG: hypothetical protein JXP34_20905 [Planctomycetes bacterium]|nr:hypothetical protein [Planctomycetota bacterium]
MAGILIAIAVLCAAEGDARDASRPIGELIEIQSGAGELLDTLRGGMEKLATRLASEGRTEEADRIRAALKGLMDRTVADDMRQAVERLKDSNLTGALEIQKLIIENLSEILAALEGRMTDPRAFDEARERVRAAREAIGALLSDAEKSLEGLRDAADSSDAARAAAEARARAESLAKDQEELRDRPPKGPGAEERDLADAVARVESIIDRQRDLRDRAGALAAADRALSRSGERALAGALARARSLVERLRQAGKGDAKASAKDAAAEARDLAAETERATKEAAGKGLVDPQLAEKASAVAEAVEAAAGDAEARARSVMESLEAAASQVEEAGAAARKLAGMAPEQGNLERSAREEMARMPQAGGAPSAAEARAEAMRELGEAADAMARAAERLQDGGRSEARDEQERAIGSLEAARDRMRGTLDTLRGRTPAQRSAARQADLTRRAEGLERELEGLERKLGGDESVAEARKHAAASRGAMERAEEALSSGGGDPGGEARSAQDEAARELREAARALGEAEKDRLERLERLSELEREQSGLEKRARELSDRLSAPDEPEPVRRAGRHTSRAGGSMGRAQERLRAGEPNDAADAGQDSVDELREADRALAEGEEELERLAQEREIVSLVQDLEAIAAGEEEIHRATVDAEGKRSGGDLPRPEKLQVKMAADRQQELREKAEGVRKVLDEEGAHAFSFVAGEVGADMVLVAENLNAWDTGTYTQLLELGIIQRVRDLRAALEEELERRRDRPREPNRQQPPGGQPKPRLVPPAAEVLLLMKSQEDINRETLRIEAASKARGDMDRSMERALERLSFRQEALDSTLEKMAAAMLGPSAPPGTEDGGSSDGGKGAGEDDPGGHDAGGK